VAVVTSPGGVRTICISQPSVKFAEYLDAELDGQCPGLAIVVDEHVVPETYTLLAHSRPDDAK
jgi:hypothetical protein